MLVYRFNPALRGKYKATFCDLLKCSTYREHDMESALHAIASDFNARLQGKIEKYHLTPIVIHSINYDKREEKRREENEAEIAIYGSGKILEFQNEPT